SHSITAAYGGDADFIASTSAVLTQQVLAVPSAPVFTAIADDTGASSSDRVTRDPTLVLSGTADANSTITLSHTGVGVIGTTTSNLSGFWSFDYTATPLPQGTYSFTAIATDFGGNSSVASAAFSVTIDLTAPTTPAITGIISDTGSSGGDAITADSTLILTGTAEANSVLT